MGLKPNIQKTKKFVFKKCACCGNEYGPEGFMVTKSPFYPDGSINICNSCVGDFLQEHDYEWKWVNKTCQFMDIPFVPSEWEKIKEMNSVLPFSKYAEIFNSSEYDALGWEDYDKEFRRLRDSGQIEDELPEIREAKRKQQKKKWGANYDDEALDYLDNLYNGLMTTQNINGKLQLDQAEKICKISYEIDKRIEEGTDFDKLLSSYDKLVKTAEFTPRNVKNINDFDTTGELIKWMEKRGWRNTFYDDVSRDIVDETIKNFQNFNQRLYTNETGIGDNINNRIAALKSVEADTSKAIDNYYGTNIAEDLDEFDNEGYERLFGIDEFNADVESDVDE